jgi:hypothetical protein
MVKGLVARKITVPEQTLPDIRPILTDMFLNKKIERTNKPSPDFKFTYGDLENLGLILLVPSLDEGARVHMSYLMIDIIKPTNPSDVLMKQLDHLFKLLSLPNIALFHEVINTFYQAFRLNCAVYRKTVLQKHDQSISYEDFWFGAKIGKNISPRSAIFVPDAYVGAVELRTQLPRKTTLVEKYTRKIIPLNKSYFYRSGANAKFADIYSEQTVSLASYDVVERYPICEQDKYEKDKICWTLDMVGEEYEKVRKSLNQPFQFVFITTQVYDPTPTRSYKNDDDWIIIHRDNMHLYYGVFSHLFEFAYHGLIDANNPTVEELKSIPGIEPVNAIKLQKALLEQHVLSRNGKLIV